MVISGDQWSFSLVLGILLRPLKHFESVVEGLLSHIINARTKVMRILAELAHKIGIEDEANFKTIYWGFQDHFAHVRCLPSWLNYWLIIS